MLTEELARIRVEEAIQEGLREQFLGRILPPKKKSVSIVILPLVSLLLLLAIGLGA
jgi:hypothetical protein